jgi:prepilin-type N-terminal cleavage/methylation domain-containing protein
MKKTARTNTPMKVGRRDQFISKDAGFTLVELLVVFAIIGILLGLLMPAVQQAREAARRTMCQSQMIQIGLAIRNYESSYGHLPAGTIDDLDPVRPVPVGYKHNWLTSILPFLDQPNLYAAIDFQVGAFHPNNLPVRDLAFEFVMCPSSPYIGTYSNYGAVYNGAAAPITGKSNGLMFLNSAVELDTIPDGMSTTLLLAERQDFWPRALGRMAGTRDTLVCSELRPASGFISGVSWPTKTAEYQRAFAPEELDVGQLGKRMSTWDVSVDGPDPHLEAAGIDSAHAGGANICFGDLQIRFISNDVDSGVLKQLGNRMDRLPLVVPRL